MTSTHLRALLGVLVCAGASSAAEVDGPARSPGGTPVVYAYGKLLSAPFVLEEVGTDTLLLNGLVYDPVPKRSRAALNEAVPGLSEAGGKHRLIQSIGKERRRALASAESEAAERDSLIAVYERSEYVEWVEPTSDGVKVKYTFSERPEYVTVFSGVELVSHKETAAKRHAHLMETFRNFEKKAGFIAFGMEYRFAYGSASADSLTHLVAELTKTGRVTEAQEAFIEAQQVPVQLFVEELCQVLSLQ